MSEPSTPTVEDKMEGWRKELCGRDCVYNKSILANVQHESILPFIHSLADKKVRNPLVMLKIVLIAIFLGPIRLLGLGIGCTYILVWQLVMSIGIKRPYNEHMTPLRQMLINLNMAVTGYGACFFTGIIPHAVYHGTTKVHSADASCIVSNHVSWMDPLVHAALFQPSYVTRADLMKVPIFWGARIVEPVLVNRSSNGHAAQEVAESVEVRERYPHMPPITVFCEGTTTNGLGLMQFKSGAFAAGKSVNPVVLDYRGAASVSWETCSFVSALFRTITQLYTVCDVHVLAPYEPNDEEREDPQLFADNVRQYMAEQTDKLLFDSRGRHKIAYERWKGLDKKDRTQETLGKMLEAAMKRDELV